MSVSRRKRVQHWIEYAGVRSLAGLTALLPLGVTTRIGAGLGWTAYRVFRVRRRVVLENVRASLSLAEGDVTADRIGELSYMNLGRCMAEYVSQDKLTPEAVREMVRLEGTEHFDEALSKRRGAIFCTAHFGNWELFGARMRRDYVMDFLVGEQANPMVDDRMNALRRSQGLGIIPRQMALRGVLRALKDNHIVAMLPDQDARRAGVFVDFLGRPASTVRGPAVFAIKQRCPIVTGYMRRIGGGKHVGTIEPPLWPDESLDGDDAVRDLTQRYTDRLSAAIRANPAEYFWAHRRWKTKPE